MESPSNSETIHLLFLRSLNENETLAALCLHSFFFNLWVENITIVMSYRAICIPQSPGKMLLPSGQFMCQLQNLSMMPTFPVNIIINNCTLLLENRHLDKTDLLKIYLGIHTS